LIAYCNLALFKTNKMFNPTCADNGSVNEYVYVDIIPGTTIVGECWGSNFHLGSEGLAYHTIEHSVSFLDSRTVFAHTNTIETMCKHTKFTSGITEKTSLNV